MTAQEIFNKVIEHLLKQGFQCLDQGDVCLYRGDNGMKCAIGVLIKDKDYNPKMEGDSASLIVHNIQAINYILPSDMDKKEGCDFLDALQSLHDDHPFFDTLEFKAAVAQFAEDYKLECTL